MSAVTGIPRAFRASFWRDPRQRAQSLFCHGELVAAIAAERPEMAEAVMRMHVRGAGAFLAEVMNDPR